MLGYAVSVIEIWSVLSFMQIVPRLIEVIRSHNSREETYNCATENAIASLIKICRSVRSGFIGQVFVRILVRSCVEFILIQ